VVLTNNSRGGAQDYAEWLGIDVEAIPVIYNGLDIERIQLPTREQTLSFRRQHNIPLDAPVMGGMFRLSPEKRPLLWLEVAALIAIRQPDAVFVLFGEGPLRPAIDRFISQHALGTRVRVRPPTQHSALALAAFDVLLLTSQWEGTPNVAIEAQAAATPVILTGGGGASEAVAAGQTGVFIEQDEPEAIAQAVLELFADAQQRQKMAASGPAFVEARFRTAAMLKATCEVYGTAFHPGMMAGSAVGHARWETTSSQP
jgi:glycosyltransferase involved in cell wall biosynthesis